MRNQALAMRGGFAGRKDVAPGGIDVIPLLCVNTWEHVWLRDYGIGGKRAFLEAWWEVINWEEVANASSITRPLSYR
jgi:Fe-Mn family superoxide dismutase